MRHAGHIAGFALAAAGMAGPAPAQPQPQPLSNVAAPSADASVEAPAAPLRPPHVNLRLSPDLGDAMDQVRAALVGLPSVRIAEPADYELTTKRDFPQTLVAVDARQAEDDWQNDFTLDPVRPAPRRVELGNLSLGDFQWALHDLVGRTARANLLLSRPDGGRSGDPAACLIATSRDNSAATDCHQGPRRFGIDAYDQYDTLSAVVRNSLGRPRYVALLLVDPSARISHIPFKDGAAVRPLAPGSEVESERLDLSASMSRGGNYVLVTISSDRPVDVSAFDPVSVEGEHQAACAAAGQPPNCPRPASVPDHWSIALAEFHYTAPRLMGIGGGMSVLDGMAPWMAEIYSTVPYTPAEIEADRRKPAGQREYLAERSAAERNHRCGGTLIGARLVLTAAHCVADGRFAGAGMAKVLKDRRVRVGTKRLGRGGTTMAIVGVAVPSSYSPPALKDDIALLLLGPDRDTRPFDEAVIQLGQRPIAAGTAVTAFGWGYTGAVAPDTNPLFNLADELQRNPDMLQFGRMTTLGWSACRRRLPSRLGPGMVCLVAPGAETGATPERNVFSCRGDSGGPLVRQAGGAEELIGVTSWSLGCGFRDIPSVYTDVTKYRRWIAAAMQQIRPGAVLRIDERTAPSPQGRRRQ